jgi:AcrR family transcriptional regulator
VAPTGNTPKRSPGRPRDASYDALILGEVLHELSVHGFRRFSVQRVADRAGVAKATVTLRWPDRDKLILDGLGLMSTTMSEPDTGTLRGDLRHTVHEWAELYRSEELMRLFGQLQAEQNDNPIFFESFQSGYARPANGIAVQVIENARRRGEVRAGVDPVAAARCLVGSLYLHAIMDRTITPAFEEQIVDLVVCAVERPPSLGGTQ